MSVMLSIVIIVLTLASFALEFFTHRRAIKRISSLEHELSIIKRKMLTMNAALRVALDSGIETEGSIDSIKEEIEALKHVVPVTTQEPVNEHSPQLEE